MTRLAAAIDRLTRWYVGDALPLWAKRAADASGAFYESLDFSGAPLTGQPRRVRVQCRQIHTFTDAARRGWLPDGETIAAKGFARLFETSCPEGGARGGAHLVDDSGAIIDATRDLYDQAFLLLACAARLRAAKDSLARRLAERTLAFLDRELASPHGGFLENDRRQTPRRQNPHMHLFEATMALYEATGEAAHISRARALDQLFSARFLDRTQGVLREFFTDDWRLDPAKGETLEPGHMAEWIFLLDRFETLTGEDRSAEKRLLERAVIAMAAPEDAPFLPNRRTLGAAPARGARRLWPQTEALKAALVFARDGDRAAAVRAASIIDALFETYLDQPTPGLWMDEYDAAGRPVAGDVPASILYHLHEAVSCAAECRHRLTP
ncbi:MAG: hypothetical protein A3E78_00240 [Alphaproteobacteria bacterium RIFCSPHIGHO2_12_FULL_63_12]|nr:MAG: hypothetical protein A3E78_00240 [Alphaproteobacteria bacterium RIFCSPHIGHO2_12_FULL_63_12]